MSQHCSLRQQTHTDCNLWHQSSIDQTQDGLRTLGCSPCHQVCSKFQISCLYSPAQICPKSLGRCTLCAGTQESFQVSLRRTPCSLLGNLRPRWSPCEFTLRHVSHVLAQALILINFRCTAEKVPSSCKIDKFLTSETFPFLVLSFQSVPAGLSDCPPCTLPIRLEELPRVFGSFVCVGPTLCHCVCGW